MHILTDAAHCAPSIEEGLNESTHHSEQQFNFMEDFAEYSFQNSTREKIEINRPLWLHVRLMGPKPIAHQSLFQRFF